MDEFFKSMALDLVHLDKYIAGDVALRDEILSMFAERAIQLNGELKTTQTDQERKITLHTLKGGARGVGAWALGDLCEKAERINGMPDKSVEQSALIVKIDAAVDEAAAAIQSLRKAA